MPSTAAVVTTLISRHMAFRRRIDVLGSLLRRTRNRQGGPVPAVGTTARLHDRSAPQRRRRVHMSVMDKPRIFLGSSGKQQKLLQALTRGLDDVARVEPWTTSFNPGTTTLERLVELAREVDFAAFVFARDDWTTSSPPASDDAGTGQASPETMSSSRPVSSVQPSACAARSSFMRGAPSSERSPRPDLCPLRQCDRGRRDEGPQSEAAAGD